MYSHHRYNCFKLRIFFYWRENKGKGVCLHILSRVHCVYKRKAELCGVEVLEILRTSVLYADPNACSYGISMHFDFISIHRTAKYHP